MCLAAKLPPNQHRLPILEVSTRKFTAAICPTDKPCWAKIYYVAIFEGHTLNELLSFQQTEVQFKATQSFRITTAMITIVWCI